MLSAVFVPMAFFGGSTGVIYRQFAITIVSAMILSVLIAMILTPALCATLLKPVARAPLRREAGWFNWFFCRFNAGFDRGSRATVGRASAAPPASRALPCSSTRQSSRSWPCSSCGCPRHFSPTRTRAIIVCQVQLPAGATQERTMKVIEQLERHFAENETAAVDSVLTISGFSFAGRGQNMGLAFVKLKDWKLRQSRELRAPAVAAPGDGRLLPDHGTAWSSPSCRRR